MTQTSVLPDAIEPLGAITRVPEGGSERRGFIFLDRNERTSPLPDWVLDELRRNIDSALLTDYPWTDELHSELSGSLRLPPERVLLTPGSDPVFRSLFQIYGRVGERAVMLDPSYAMYQVYARMFGLEPVGIPFDMELRPALDQMLAAIDGTVRLVLLANPNQPTGTVLSRDELRTILARAETTGAVVAVDEAYESFTTEPSALWLLAESRNLLLVRSWSKAGFAGARIGFVAGDEEVVGQLRKVRSAADVSSFGALCGRLLVRHPEITDQYGAEVRAGGALLSERGRELGLEPLPFHANFLLIRLPSPLEPAAVVDALRERKWLIKGPFGAPALAGCIRVTLGPPQLMEQFAEVLSEAIGSLR
jgi:histidinol-phosphate aminotransferase